MKMLKSKLLDLKEKEQKEKIEDLKGEQKDIAWGSQIRSYVFCPYTMVKDHRTNYEVGNVEAVMDGDLNDFMEKYLKNNIDLKNKLLSKKTLLNEFNHFEYDMCLFMPSLDISDNKLKEERDNIISICDDIKNKGI